MLIKELKDKKVLMNFQMNLFDSFLQYEHSLFSPDYINNILGIKDTQWFIDLIEKYCVVNRQGLRCLDYTRLLDYLVNLKIFSQKTTLSFSQLCLIEEELNNIPLSLDHIITNNFKNPTYETL